MPRMDNPAAPRIFRRMKMVYDVAIVGGGLNGPVLALGLAQRGLRVAVIDARPAGPRDVGDFDGRAYALAHGSSRLLSGVKVWDDIRPSAQPMLEIKVTDGRLGEGPAPWMMHFDHAELEEGPMGYMVEDRYLRSVLRVALDAEPGVDQFDGEPVNDQTIDPSGVLLTLASGQTITAHLCVGADGRHSGTAARAGIKRTGWHYDQTALVCAIEHEQDHASIAHQFFMPGGPLAILPLTENRCSLVWSEATSRADALIAMDDGAFLEALRPAVGSFLGAFTLVGQRTAYPLGLTVANRLIGDRVALVGDAAHGIHPIAGQGLNAGLRDVAALIDVLTTARNRGEDFGTPVVLSRYEQWRRFDATTLAVATDTFNRLFSNDNPLLRAARNIGMGAINATPRLRRAFVRQAAGLTGELPSLMRG